VGEIDTLGARNIDSVINEAKSLGLLDGEKMNLDLYDFSKIKEMFIDQDTKLSSVSTPAANWRKNGEEDPFATYIEMQRSTLVCGNMTDDELANAVYLSPGIANLTGAKERIRWLSRKLEQALSEEK
jgi:hypothetical protein